MSILRKILIAIFIIVLTVLLLMYKSEKNKLVIFHNLIVNEIYQNGISKITTQKCTEKAKTHINNFNEDSYLINEIIDIKNTSNETITFCIGKYMKFHTDGKIVSENGIMDIVSNKPIFRVLLYGNENKDFKYELFNKDITENYYKLYNRNHAGDVSLDRYVVKIIKDLHNDK